MLGNHPIASEPVVGSPLEVTTPSTAITVDEFAPRCLATVTNIVAISGFVFSGTPNTPATLLTYEPPRPPIQRPKPIQRPYDDTNFRYATNQQSAISVEPPVKPIPSVAKPIIRSVDDVYYRYANDQQSAIGLEPARPQTIKSRGVNISVLLPTSVFIPSVVAPSFPIIGQQPKLVPGGLTNNWIAHDEAWPPTGTAPSPPGGTPDYGWDQRPAPHQKKKPPIFRGHQTGTVGVFFYMPYNYGWFERSRPEAPADKRRILRSIHTVHLIPPSSAFPFTQPMPCAVPGGIREHHGVIAESAVLQTFPTFPFTQPTTIPVPGGIIENHGTIGEASVLQIVEPTYDYGWKNDVRIPGAIREWRRAIHYTHIPPPAPSYDYGWTERSRPQRPADIKRLLRPPEHTFITSNRATYDFGWKNEIRLPNKVKPSRGALLKAEYIPFISADPKTLVTGIITDPAGNPATSGYVLFTLQGGTHEEQNYRVTGTTIILNKTVSTPINPDGSIFVRLWGNDLITPTGSWYKVTFVPNGRIHQVTNFVYISGPTYDITNPVFI